MEAFGLLCDYDHAYSYLYMEICVLPFSNVLICCRDLLVSIRFDEPGWLWSGSFFPDHLGDTQVKMRNYVSGASNMIRVEVQNADVTIRDERLLAAPMEMQGQT